MVTAESMMETDQGKRVLSIERVVWRVWRYSAPVFERRAVRSKVESVLGRGEGGGGVRGGAAGAVERWREADGVRRCEMQIKRKGIERASDLADREIGFRRAM